LHETLVTAAIGAARSTIRGATEPLSVCVLVGRSQQIKLWNEQDFQAAEGARTLDLLHGKRYC
jgi:DNA-binding transcriptional regulator/RsmH inhibitor MraZ